MKKRKKRNESPGPDFLCIGPPRTGTTWLDRNLRKHPGIYLTPKNEIRYFWERQYFGMLTLFDRLFTGDRYYKHHRSFLIARIKKRYLSIFRNFSRKNIKDLAWDLHYFLGRHNNNWYLKLFRHKDGRLAGDISPQYFTLTEDNIRKIKELLPGIKIIITLRNPIEREWSRAKMRFLQTEGKKFEEVGEEVFARTFERNRKNNPMYVELINRWQEVFGRENVYVAFFDNLIENPESFINEITSFLGLEESIKIEERTLKEKVNKGLELSLPERLKELLVRLYRESIIELSELYPEQVNRWIEKYNL